MPTVSAIVVISGADATAGSMFSFLNVKGNIKPARFATTTMPHIATPIAKAILNMFALNIPIVLALICAYPALSIQNDMTNYMSC